MLRPAFQAMKKAKRAEWGDKRVTIQASWKSIFSA